MRGLAVLGPASSKPRTTGKRRDTPAAAKSRSDRHGDGAEPMGGCSLGWWVPGQVRACGASPGQPGIRMRRVLHPYRAAPRHQMTDPGEASMAGHSNGRISSTRKGLQSQDSAPAVFQEWRRRSPSPPRWGRPRPRKNPRLPGRGREGGQVVTRSPKEPLIRVGPRPNARRHRRRGEESLRGDHATRVTGRTGYGLIVEAIPTIEYPLPPRPCGSNLLENMAGNLGDGLVATSCSSARGQVRLPAVRRPEYLHGQ